MLRYNYIIILTIIGILAHIFFFTISFLMKYFNVINYALGLTTAIQYESRKLKHLVQVFLIERSKSISGFKKYIFIGSSFMGTRKIFNCNSWKFLQKHTVQVLI